MPFILLFIAGSLVADDKIEVGTKAPEFSLQAVGAEDTVALTDFVSKKIVIVHFWKSK
jgi:peroxiredoxin